MDNVYLYFDRGDMHYVFIPRFVSLDKNFESKGIWYFLLVFVIWWLFQGLLLDNMEFVVYMQKCILVAIGLGQKNQPLLK